MTQRTVYEANRDLTPDGAIDRLKQELAEARAQLAERDALLREFEGRIRGGHSRSCLSEYEEPCSCGLTDLLQRIAAALGEGHG